ncbi:MAG TPA: GHMP kinase [Chloroflexus aurantiacus]|jgi:D-glycero-alpha-D-manno-heptose-7-phosphate kinase|uniref:GHMP kinase n=1 Tax=Chloroflexus aurantiacus (strain ATCC 29366 / DSM 635 / J-10-fl) TaxID=324602 RepID=A9WBX6_CHLAA|nr:GHMP kinase [Chloroflexus aurantiacus]ABY36928.1 GHMP kinase [Chloroflexus aurantiacus J-10-fl]RMG47862.1 MAG: GHMP kinase [Chloroflexota bacterium]GIV93312.1 MAG: GHMP kinase [Chloroflexus sp.]HBW66641.1 GHMP kinase [Chloroflexus aurantiacus]
MIISRTPLRVSFVGGGSDLPAFYRHEPGAVVSTAINKYIYITVNEKFDHQIRASYSITEIVERVDDLKHQLIREALRLVGRMHAIEITSISDIPSQGTGLGSSSTYTVGLLNALYAFIGRFAGAERLAREACFIEIDRCGSPIGKQDQYIAAYGGFQFIQFNPDETVFVDPIICRADTKQLLQQRLLMMYTGATRSASDVLREQSANTERDETRRQHVRRMVALAHDLRVALHNDDLDAFGEILHEGWMRKRELASGISSSQIDLWYERARAAGAIGGKILGAGGGGFLLLYAPEERHETIKAALPELRHVPIRFEPQGSKIIYVEER